MKKKAILVVSYGTSHIDTLEKNILAIEQEIAVSFPEYQVYRGFTGEMVIAILKKRWQMGIDTVTEAMERMLAAGVTEVIIQPTHIIQGTEYEKMMTAVWPYRERFSSFQTGRALLEKPEDYELLVQKMMGEIRLSETENLVLVGHGSSHDINTTYTELERTFHRMGHQNVVIGTLGTTLDAKHVKNRLKQMEKQEVILRPFLIVAGTHARKDIAGGEDSWKTQLESAGYEVKTILEGLGQIRGIREIFAGHVREAIDRFQ